MDNKAIPALLSKMVNAFTRDYATIIKTRNLIIAIDCIVFYTIK